MKSVLISIKPKWCEMIVNGKKTIEIRKTRPKIDTPFKCYIYCTKGSYKSKYLHTSNKQGRLLFWENPNDTSITVQPENYHYMAYTCRGKAIGEFMCNSIYTIFFYSDILYGEDFPNDCLAKICNESGLSLQELKQYANGKDLFGWHISDLVIYDQPKELSDFYSVCPEWERCEFTEKCNKCKHFIKDNEAMCCICDIEGEKPLTRPPQSWCYVEKEENK